MEPQKNTSLIIGVIVVIVLAISAGVYYSWPKSGPSLPDEVMQNVRTPAQIAIDNAAKSILVRHRYVDGVHTYTGVVEVPTPCHSVAAEGLVLQSFPEKVQIILSTIPPAPGTVCAQVITEKPFSVSYKASATTAGDNLSATLDGKTVLFILGGKD